MWKKLQELNVRRRLEIFFKTFQDRFFSLVFFALSEFRADLKIGTSGMIRALVKQIMRMF